MCDFNDKEQKIKAKGKVYAIITFCVIGIILFFIIIGVFFIKVTFNEFKKHKYYVIEVNDSNKNEIISLLDDEKLNYCESMYKVEYEISFMGDIFSKIYCKG